MKMTLAGLALIAFGASAYASTASLQSASVDYTADAISSDLPKTLQDQTIALNEKVKKDAFNQAIQKLDSICIDPSWSSANQEDIISVKTSAAKPIDGGFQYTVTVEAVCRSKN